MTPNSDVNLENFLASYGHRGAFYLMPAVLRSAGSPDLLFDLTILKRKISIKLAADVGEQDVEFMGPRGHLKRST